VSDLASSSRFFTHDEAQAKLGRIVRTRVPGRRIPQGTEGRVVYARRQGDSYALGIQWRLTPVPLVFTILPRPPFLGLRRTPAVDWVRKDQYERYLFEDLTGKDQCHDHI
jgi:hypothetical protein